MSSEIPRVLDRVVELRIMDGPLKNCRELHRAIGYLATWAAGSPRYLKCRIFVDEEGYAEATYFSAEGDVTYVIGAVRRGEGETLEYSFHS